MIDGEEPLVPMPRPGHPAEAAPLQDEEPAEEIEV
jgi:hypothetical protein